MEEVCEQPPNNDISTICNPETAYHVLKNGKPKDIFEMLQQKTDLDYNNDRGDTVLHAILRNDKLIEKDVTDILLIFLTQGVCPNTKNNNQETVLHLAVGRRMKNAMDCLLKFKADIHTMNEQGNSIAHFFIEDEYEKCKSSMKYPLMNTVENRNAMENCSVDFLQFLIAKGVNFNGKNKKRQSASHLAIEYYLPHILCILLHVTNDLMTIGMYNNTLLEFILEESISMSRLHLPDENQYPGYKSRYATTIFEILLKKVVYANYDPSFLSQVTKKSEKICIMKALINYYLNNCEIKDYANTLEDKKLHMMEFLKDSDMDFSFKSNNGQTLLHWLAEEKNTERVISQFCGKICDFLVSRGCEVNAIGKEEKSALHVAAARTNIPMVRKLIELGADFDCRDKDMRTPLHEAVKTNESEEIVEALLNNGADVNVEDSNGKTPLHLAVFNDSQLISMMLLKNGANINVKNLKSLSSMYKRRRKWSLGEGAFFNLRKFKSSLTANQTEQELYMDNRTFMYWKNSGVEEPILFVVAMIDKLLKCKADLNDLQVKSFIRTYCPRAILHNIKRHWVRLEVADLSFNSEYKKLINKGYGAGYRGECLEEIEKLKNTFINDRKSLYEFLRMHFSKRVAYVNNEKLRKIVESRTLFEQFPNYSVILRASYREAVTRKTKLLEPAKAAFYELIHGKLTDAYTIDHILAYLTDKDLFSITEANE